MQFSTFFSLYCFQRFDLLLQIWCNLFGILFLLLPCACNSRQFFFIHTLRSLHFIMLTKVKQVDQRRANEEKRKRDKVLLRECRSPSETYVEILVLLISGFLYTQKACLFNACKAKKSASCGLDGSCVPAIYLRLLSPHNIILNNLPNISTRFLSFRCHLGKGLFRRYQFSK